MGSKASKPRINPIVLQEEKKEVPPANSVDMSKLIYILDTLKLQEPINIDIIQVAVNRKKSYLNDIETTLEMILRQGLPCSLLIILALIEQANNLMVISPVLLELNTHLVVTVKDTISIIKLGTYAAPVAAIFLDLAAMNIEVTPKIWEIILKEAPSENIKNIYAALEIIGIFIKEVIRLANTDHVVIKNGYLEYNEHMNFGWICQIRCNKNGMDETPKNTDEEKTYDEEMVIELSDIILEAIGKADNPQTLANAIVFLNANTIILSDQSLIMLANNSFHAVTIMYALESLFKAKKQPAEAVIQEIIDAGEYAEIVAQNYLESQKKLHMPSQLKEKPKLPHAQCAEQKSTDQQKKSQHTFKFDLGIGTLNLNFGVVFKKKNKAESNLQEQKEKLTPRPSSSSRST